MENQSNKQAGAFNATDETFNGNYTAIPRDIAAANQAAADSDLVTTGLEYGEMNEEDAKASGYTDENGRAVEMAKKDTEGSPTGAYTDIGAGRSSVVHEHQRDQDKHH